MQPTTTGQRQEKELRVRSRNLCNLHTGSSAGQRREGKNIVHIADRGRESRADGPLRQSTLNDHHHENEVDAMCRRLSPSPSTRGAVMHKRSREIFAHCQFGLPLHS